jgi:hypothetical protein
MTHKAGLFWTSDQPVAEASTYTGQHNIETAGFEPATPATKRPQTYALGRADTKIGNTYLHSNIITGMSTIYCIYNTITRSITTYGCEVRQIKEKLKKYWLWKSTFGVDQKEYLEGRLEMK